MAHGSKFTKQPISSPCGGYILGEHRGSVQKKKGEKKIKEKIRQGRVHSLSGLTNEAMALDTESFSEAMFEFRKPPHTN